jgi:hypothetical protein
MTRTEKGHGSGWDQSEMEAEDEGMSDTSDDSESKTKGDDVN